MEVSFSPEVEAQLGQVAAIDGRNAEQLLKETIQRMLEERMPPTAEI